MVIRLSPGSTAAFHHRNFRLYWSAQLISLMGTFMQQVALGYLVYDLTGSKWLLGAISALTMGPSLLLSLPAGVLADRVPRRRLVLCTQTSALLLAFILATLTALHRLQVWEILVLSTFSGIAIAMESPARQALVADLVGGEDLPNAIGWNSLVMNGSRVLGPAVGGVAIRFIGVAPIFYYNSLSFAAMIGALLLMRLPVMTVAGRHPWRDLREGLDYLRRTPSIVCILALVAAVATFVMNFSVLMPVIAHDTLHTGPAGLGWMWTAMGLGAVAGSMTVVAWSRAAVAGPMLLLVALVASASTAALAVTSSMPAALAMLLVVGWGTGAFFASANSAIQHRVTDRVRGRVLSVYSMIFAGTTPIGGLFVAAVASSGGISLALAAAGGISLAIGVVLAMPVLRTLAMPPLASPAAPALDRPAS
jgi:MFS family permease